MSELLWWNNHWKYTLRKTDLFLWFLGSASVWSFAGRNETKQWAGGWSRQMKQVDEELQASHLPGNQLCRFHFVLSVCRLVQRNIRCSEDEGKRPTVCSAERNLCPVVWNWNAVTFRNFRKRLQVTVIYTWDLICFIWKQTFGLMLSYML